MATAILFAISLVLSVGTQRALRRLRVDGQVDTTLHSFVKQVALLAGSLTIVSAVFMIAAAFLSSTPSDKLISAAFTAEGTLDWLRSWVQFLAVPWPVSVLVLLVVFLLSIARAIDATADGAGALWLARVVAQQIKSYSKLLTSLNLLLGVACSLTLFGSALDVDTAEFRVRLKQTEARLEKIANGAAEVVTTEVQTRAAAAVLSTPPAPVERAAEAVIRLEQVIVDAEAARARARRDFRIDAPAPRWSTSSDQSRGGNSRPSERASVTPRPTSGQSTVPSDATFSAVEDAELEVTDRLTSEDIREKARMIAELEARKALTGSFVKKAAKASLAAAFGSAHALTLTEIVAGVVTDAMAEAANRNVERWVSAWIGARLGDGRGSSAPTLRDAESVVGESEAVATAERLWTAAATMHGDALKTTLADVERQTAQVRVEHADIERRTNRVIASLRVRHETALERIARGLARRERGVNVFGERQLDSPEGLLAELRNQRLTYEAVERAEATAASVEANLVTDERPAPDLVPRSTLGSTTIDEILRQARSNKIDRPVTLGRPPVIPPRRPSLPPRARPPARR